LIPDELAIHRLTMFVCSTASEGEVLCIYL
jgi:hypothetical protein